MATEKIPEYDNAFEEAERHFYDEVESVGKREAEGEEIDTQMWVIQTMYTAAYWLTRVDYGLTKKDLYEQIDEAYTAAIEHNKEDAADAKKGKKKD